MRITSATFVKGVIGTDAILDRDLPQVAFIGRSNVGKSSTINAIVGRKNLAQSSNKPGKTRQINVYLINQNFYLLDLPGYGFASGSREDREWLTKVINWYLFRSGHEQKLLALIIDANVGPTKDDLEMIEALETARKNYVIVANKVDKIKKSEYDARLQKVKEVAGFHRVIPFSSAKGIGIGELIQEILT